MSLVRPNTPELVNDDCMTVIKSLPDACIDLIAADLPYEVTALPWDRRLPMSALWDEFRRILTPTGTAVLHAAQPFSSDLVVAGGDLFKYSLVWQKTRPTAHLHCKNRTLCDHEDVLVFSKGVVMDAKRSARRMTYNPFEATNGGEKHHHTVRSRIFNRKVGHAKAGQAYQSQTGHPRSVLRHASPANPFHPTQKPLSLLEWIIRTYSDAGDIVLDPTMGSGTAGVAAVRHGRDFFGIEADPRYFTHAETRIMAEFTGELETAAPPPIIPVKLSSRGVRANLSPRDINTIRARAKAGEHHHDIARDYTVSRATVGNVVNFNGCYARQAK